MRKVKITLPPLHSGRENRTLLDEKYGGREKYNFGGQVACAQAFVRKEVIFAGRRWGKSNYGMFRLFNSALQGGKTWWIWPSQPDARDGWEYLKEMCKQVPGNKIWEVDKRVSFSGLGSIQIKSAHEPRALRGRGLHHVVMDEASYMRHGKYIYGSIISESLMDYKGGVTIITSPNGYDWVFDLFRQAADHPSWTAFRFPTWDNPHIDVSEIEELKNDPMTSDEDFRREVAAESFASAEAVFGNFYKAAKAVPQLKPIPDHEYTAGIDLARLHDWAVVSVTDSTGFLKPGSDKKILIPHQVHLERTKGLAWSQIVARFVNVLQTYGVDTVKVDSTGAGDPLIEQFEDEVYEIDENIAIDPFNFNKKSKGQLIKRYAIALERESYYILKDEASMAEHKNFEAKMNPDTKHISYSSGTGFDDIVITNALNYLAHQERWIE